ncbi:9344_t:CDS:2, partial [Cetraspora pellucida]
RNERSKTYHISVSEYVKWINNLERSGLNYYRHDRQVHGAQKESKKCGCKSSIYVMLPVNSPTVILKHYYKHVNHYPGRLSDLYTLPLSNNIRKFIRQCAFEGLDTFSIQRLLRHRAIELQDQ